MAAVAIDNGTPRPAPSTLQGAQPPESRDGSAAAAEPSVESKPRQGKKEEEEKGPGRVDLVRRTNRGTDCRCRGDDRPRCLFRQPIERTSQRCRFTRCWRLDRRAQRLAERRCSDHRRSSPAELVRRSRAGILRRRDDRSVDCRPRPGQRPACHLTYILDAGQDAVRSRYPKWRRNWASD